MTEQERKQCIADGIRAERNRRRLSQQELADRIGRLNSTISGWEQTGSVSLEDAWSMADALGISLDQLAGRTTA